MGRIYAIANQKGGVGKSTTAVNVGGYLGEWGLRTLLIDLDPQSNATSGVGVAHAPDRPSVYSVLIEGRPAAEAILPTSVPGLDLLPSDIALVGAELELTGLPQRDSRLLYALDGLTRSYDYILIDCPPSLGLLTLNALIAARHLLLPVQCEFYALEGLAHLSYTLDLVRQQSNPGLELAGIVMTLYDARTTLSAQVVDEVRRMYPDLVFHTLIPRNVRLSEAPSYGMTIGQYNPRSRGGTAYADLTREIIARAAGESPGSLAGVAQPLGHAGALVTTASADTTFETEPQVGAEAPEGVIDG
jgi:chromosome partitioning protein